VIRVLVCGAAGRMGGVVLDAVRAAPDLAVGAALEAPGHPRLGEEVEPGVALTDNPRRALDAADVAIDFTLPEATLALLPEAASRGVPVVLATTGFDDAGQAAIGEAAQKIPIVQAPNFSLGINVLLRLVAEAVRRLPDYEIEVLELHHSRKVDAPSGTALRIAEVAAAARGVDIAAKAIYHREGHTGERPPDGIGLQTLRAGDSIGEHTLYLAGPGERLELSHRALSRQNFAAGALRAARWALDKPPALYSMQDVLGD
jgi:4-hydroxy-tetrahydrodipicolinate reductase